MPFINLDKNKNQNMLKNDDAISSQNPVKQSDQTLVSQSDQPINFNVGNKSSLPNSTISNMPSSPQSASVLPNTNKNLNQKTRPIISNKNDTSNPIYPLDTKNQGYQQSANVSINQNATLPNKQNNTDDTNNNKDNSRLQAYPSLKEAPMNKSDNTEINAQNIQDVNSKNMSNNSQTTTTSSLYSSTPSQSKPRMVVEPNIDKPMENFYGEHGEKIIHGPEFEKVETKKEVFTTQKPKEAVKLDSNVSNIVENPIEQNVVIPSKAVIDDYIKIAIEKNASDIHFVVNYPVFFRVDGKLQKFGTTAVQKADAERLFEKIVPKKKWDKLVKDNIEADFMFEHKSGNRFRINIYKERGSLAGAFRLIPKKVRTIEELDLPPILKEFSKIPYGLVLVTGPTGSGKSTTIAAIIEEINRTEPRHIITIEDPVEYIYKPSLALISQRNMFEDTRSWADALRAVLREDPDVVVVGEMRDYKTIASALTVAETGHLVFATLHTNNASQTIDRIIDVFPEGQQNQVRSQLSSMLAGVISQRLVPLKKGGRKAVVEILLATVAVKNAIREGKTHQIRNIIQTSADLGMMTIEKSLVDLVRRGLIDIDTAKKFTSKPDEIDLLLK